MRIGITCAVVTAVALAACPAIAHAQAFDNLTSGSNSLVSPLAKGGSGAPGASKSQQPPALPGATSNASRVTPSERPPTDMEPTDALFDAINRGDIAAARDAITRGADLRGRNILGMSPMELSIDLGRNDISFLLLSMRGGDDGRNRQAQPATAAAKGAPARQARQVQAPVHAPRVTASRGVPASAQQPVPSQTARLFSGDGGTPVPNAGFLGFDSGRR
jgi:hypothetical protein